MADPVEGPQTSTGPHPGGIEADEVPAPGGAVVGDAGTSAAGPGDADVGGDADLGQDVDEDMDSSRAAIDAADEAD